MARRVRVVASSSASASGLSFVVAVSALLRERVEWGTGGDWGYLPANNHSPL